MKKIKILFTAILCAFFSTIFAQKTELIYFEKGSYNISNSEKIKLEKFLASNEINKDLMLEIKGFTDITGNPELNLELSKERTESVKRIILSKGFSEKNIKISFHGEENPIANNLFEEGRQKNRRVEIRITNPESDKVSIYSRFKKEPQKFTASAKENIEITGIQGTLIRIPKYSLMNSKQKTVTGEIQIFLEEYYENSDIIKANLHTLSDNQILETGGMIHIVIKHKNEELKLKKDKEIEIEFVTDDMERMETFLGETKNGNFNWKLENSTNPEPKAVNLRKNNIEVDRISFDSAAFDTIKREQIIPKNSVRNKYLTSNQLNWINCDRFLNMRKENLTNLNVHTNIPAEVKLIFKKINSIMPPVNVLNDLYEFINLPKRNQTTIIAFTEIDDEPYYASKEITIGENQIENLILEKITWEELEKEFKILNNPNRKKHNDYINIE